MRVARKADGMILNTRSKHGVTMPSQEERREAGNLRNDLNALYDQLVTLTEENDKFKATISQLKLKVRSRYSEI